MRLRRSAIWPLLILLLLAAAHTAYWVWLERRLEAGFDAWAEGLRARGWLVRSGAPALAGWPMQARLEVPDFSLEGGADEIPDGLAWNSERVGLSLRLLDPSVLSLAPAGRQRLRLASLPEVDYAARKMVATVPLGRGGDDASLLANDIRVSTRREETDAGALTIGLLEASGQAHQGAGRGAPALAFTIAAEAIGLPLNLKSPLGGRISSLSAEGAVTGPVPSVQPIARRAALWRDGGGQVAVQRLALGWGPLGLTGHGTIWLDPRLQPVATAEARIVGYGETLDALAASGAIPHGAAVAVKAFAALIATTPDGGGPPEIAVPLTLRDGAVSIRGIPLARVPEIAWPGE